MISTSADIDRYIREQPIRDANTAAKAIADHEAEPVSEGAL